MTNPNPVAEQVADLVEQNLDDTIWDAELSTGVRPQESLVALAKRFARASATEHELLRAGLAIEVGLQRGSFSAALLLAAVE